MPGYPAHNSDNAYIRKYKKALSLTYLNLWFDQPILFKSFLSQKQTTYYISLLLERKLLSYDQTTGLYHATDRGQRLLKIYKQMGSYFDSEISELPQL
jgi:hypothetical protein